MAEYVPAIIDRSMLETVDGHIETVSLGYEKDGHPKTLFTLINTAKNYAKTGSELDNCWIRGKWGDPTLHGEIFGGVYVGKNDFQLRKFVAETRDPKDYWYTLDRISDPLIYLDYLAFYKAGGICLNKYPRLCPVKYDDSLLWNTVVLYMENPRTRSPDPSAYKGEIPVDSGIQLYPPEWDVTKYDPAVSIYSGSRADNNSQIYNRIVLPSGNRPAPGYNDYFLIFSYGNGEIEYAPKSGNQREHRLLYAEYCKRFGEVILTRYLKETFGLLDFSKLEDLPTMVDAYNTLLNRVMLDIPGYINKTVKTTTRNINRKYEVERVFQYGIPDDFENGPYVYYDNQAAFPAFSDSEGTIIIPEMNFPSGAHTCKMALMREYISAVNLLLMNITKLEARIAQTSDISEKLIDTAFTRDPYANPFLIFDQSASVKQGTPVFQNVAVNLTQKDGKTDTVVLQPEAGGPSVKHYLMAPEIRATYIRKIPLEYGGSVSRSDLERMGAIDKDKSLAPYLLIGAGAAFLITQVI